MGQCFERIDARFEQVDARFEQIDVRFDQVDARFERIDERFGQIDARFDGVDERLDVLEKRMSTNEGRTANALGILGQMTVKLDRLEEDKVDRATMEETMERIAEAKKKEIMEAIDAYAKRADDQWQEHQMLAGQTSRHEEWIEKIAENLDMKLDY